MLELIAIALAPAEEFVASCGIREPFGIRSLPVGVAFAIVKNREKRKYFFETTINVVDLTTKQIVDEN